MPFIWTTSPQIPLPTPPESIPSTATSYKVDVVANTVNAGGSLLYNTHTGVYDVVYEFDTLNVRTLTTRTLNASTSNITSLNLISGTIQTNANQGIEIVNYQSRGGGGGGIANIINVFPILYEPSNGLLSLANNGIGSSYLRSNSPNGSILISNTVSSGFDERQINVHPSIHANHDKGYISLVAAGDPILSGHRYGYAWTERLSYGSFDSFNWGGLIYDGSRFVGIGIDGIGDPAVVISSDGIFWNKITYPGHPQLVDIAYNGSMYVALTSINGTIRTSTDAINWTTRTVPAGVYNDLVWADSLFIAITFNGGVISSPNGIDWDLKTPIGFGNWTDIAYGAGALVLVGVGGAIARSFDLGTVWGFPTPPSGITDFSQCIFAGGRFVAAGLGAPVGRCVAHSPDGSTWASVDTGFGINYGGIGYGNGLYFLGGVTGSVLVTTDPAAWSFVSLPTTPVEQQISKLNMFAGNGTRIVGAEQSTSASSTTGSDWVKTTLSDTDKLPIAYNGNTFVVIAKNSTFVSNNGTSWSGTPSVAGNWVSADWNGTTFVTLGVSGFIQKSTTGLSWTLQATGVSGNFKDIVAVTNTFVAVGESGAVMTGNETGTTWTPRTAPANNWKSVTYNGNLVVAVGSNNSIMTSPNGVIWTSRSGPTGNWYGVAWGSDSFVAVGNSGSVMSSYDGIGWTSRSAPNAHWTNVGWNGSVFAAVGENTLMTSPDGIHWTLRNNIPSGLWQDIRWGGNVFVATAKSIILPQPVIMSTEPEAVTSVSGKTGRVLLNTFDVTENLAGPYYHTTQRVRGNVSGITPIQYSNSNGIFSHANSGVTVSTYGNASHIPMMTVDSRGHITSLVNVSIGISTSQITSGILSVARGGTGRDATGIVNGSLLIGNTTNAGFDSAVIAQTHPIIVTNGRGSIRISHATSGAVPGTYGNTTSVPSITVDSNGHITNVTNVSIVVFPTATANGQIMIGNTISGLFQPSTLIAGSGIIINNAPGSITVSTPPTMPTGNTPQNDRLFYENDQNVTGSYAITSGKSAVSAGPITLNPSVIVTVPPGSRWVLI